MSADDLERIIGKLEAGANLVLGWRRQRHDPVGRLLMSRILNLLGRLWIGYSLHDLNCGFRAFDREFLKHADV